MTDILITDFVICLFIFMRIIAVFITAPILSNAAFPTLGKIFVSAILTYITFITIVRGKNLQVDTNMIAIAIYGAREILTGLIMGYVLNFVFYGINFAGSIIGVDVGLSMSSVMNPTFEIESNSVGEVINIFAMLLFFLMNGHHYIINAMVGSFKIIPIGKYAINQTVFGLMMNYAAAVFVIAVKMAAPIMVSYFLVHIAEGIVSRAIPQMQVFFVTQPVKLGLGFVLLIFALPIYVYFIRNLLESFEGNLFNIMRAMGA